MITDRLSAALEQAWPGADTGTHRNRWEALAEFRRLGFPNRKLEEWRYTDIGKIPDETRGTPITREPDESALEAARASLRSLPIHSDRQLLVLVDGHFVAELSQLDARRQSMLVRESDADGHVGPDDASGSGSLIALNKAFATPLNLQFGGAKTDRDLDIVFVTTGQEASAHVRLALDIAAGCSARVTQYFVGAEACRGGWTNVVSTLSLAENSELELIRVQNLPATHSMTTSIRPTLASHARLYIGNIDFGGSLIRTDADVRLVQEGATATLFGLAMTGSDGHADNHVCADHIAPDTQSHQIFRSIVDAGGRAVFNGKVIVRPDAQRIDAHQRSDNLLLAKNAEVDTKPELEIYADDVRCSHGATTGELDGDELFYLQSRGVPEAAAKALLTFGFANELLDRLTDNELRKHVVGLLSELLGETLPEGSPVAAEEPAGPRTARP